MLTVNYCRICSQERGNKLFQIDKMPITAEPLPKKELVPTHTLEVLSCPSCHYLFLSNAIPSSYYLNYNYTPQISSDVRNYLDQFTQSMISELGLKGGEKGLEIGAGEGSLCVSMQKHKINMVALEPSFQLSKLSEKQGVTTVQGFFDSSFYQQREEQFDFVVVRHVLEHIDNIDDFMKGIYHVLKPNGVIIIEVPYLGNIINEKQYYAFFFEHLSYFSLHSLEKMFHRYQFQPFYSKYVYPEGGSILIAAQKGNRYSKSTSYVEDSFHLQNIYTFSEGLTQFQNSFQQFVKEHRPLAAYGAGQRGITLLSLIGDAANDILYLCDENVVYHHLFTPTTSIPIVAPLDLPVDKVEGILIFATSYQNQIIAKYPQYRKKFITILPHLEFLEKKEFQHAMTQRERDRTSYEF